MSEETKPEGPEQEKPALTDDERKALEVFRADQRAWGKDLCAALAAQIRGGDSIPASIATETTYDSPLLRGVVATLIEQLPLMPTCPVRSQGGVAAPALIALAFNLAQQALQHFGGRRPPAPPKGDPFAGRPCADPKIAVDAMPPDVK